MRANGNGYIRVCIIMLYSEVIQLYLVNFDDICGLKKFKNNHSESNDTFFHIRALLPRESRTHAAKRSDSRDSVAVRL